MEARQLKALEIATTSRIMQSGDFWIVPSQSSGTKYTVSLSPFSCSCPDFEKRQQACKHLLAVLELIQHNATGQAIPSPVPAKKPTYKQEWREYRLAQVNEKAKLLELLHALCSQIDEPMQHMGRPRITRSDRIFACCFKIYSTLSGRRFMSDLAEAKRRGYLSMMPNFVSLTRYMESEEMTAILKQLIVESSLPLKTVEFDFAVDSSGFSTGVYQKWSEAKWGSARTVYGEKQPNDVNKKDWLKVHLMCGVKTNIVTSVEVTGAHDGDYPQFAPLVNQTSRNFVMNQVSADKGYSGSKNLQLVLVKGAQPFIDFKGIGA